ncbi:MAG: 2-amino-4-hydroxy-6-hydroxymethyldihydropteridine diphosphokinase [Gammaproteobacteria bacterium]|nr:MAG: 2-amino-4-hydroxy-6-hydroxymethyldihydropteridine diphosphokinase [Gammaproteobacteria bacterium]
MKGPVRAYISLGSNIEPERHITRAIEELRRLSPALVLSPVYRSRAVGFEGEDFLNLVAGLDTELPPEQLVERLRAIEDRCGRKRGKARFAPRTLDLDLILYGDRVSASPPLPRPEILAYAFVLAPLADIAGSERHPVVKETYRALWEAFDKEDQPLERVDLFTGTRSAPHPR